MNCYENMVELNKMAREWESLTFATGSSWLKYLVQEYAWVGNKHTNSQTQHSRMRASKQALEYVVDPQMLC